MGESLWNKFIYRESLTNYVSDSIEVGYSQYGPTLAVSGSMSTTSSVVFVYNISIQLTNKSDDANRQFGWFAFRPHKFTIGGYKGIDLRMASKFMITPNNPHKYNILFSDQDRYSEINPILKNVRKEWNAFAGEARSFSEGLDDKAIFGQFTQKETVQNFINELRELSYWQAGEYSIKIVVITKKSKQFFEVEKSFRLSENDAQILKDNATLIVADICRQSNVDYHFVSSTLV